MREQTHNQTLPRKLLQTFTDVFNPTVLPSHGRLSSIPNANSPPPGIPTFIRRLSPFGRERGRDDDDDDDTDGDDKEEVEEEEEIYYQIVRIQ